METENERREILEILKVVDGNKRQALQGETNVKTGNGNMME